MMKKGISFVKRHCNLKICAVFLIVFVLFIIYGSRSYDLAKRSYMISRTSCDLDYINDENYAETHSKGLKVIYGATLSFGGWHYDFSGCPHSNCVVQSCPKMTHIDRADLVIFLYQYMTAPTLLFGPVSAVPFPSLTKEERAKQTWLVLTHEAPAWSFNKFQSSLVDQKFNGAMTYRHDSSVYCPYFTGEGVKPQPKVDYAHGKSKGAFAYVSNCKSNQYDRLGLMRKLSKYVDVDIFGSCTGKYPCQQDDYECEANLHKSYRFFLSFENSLCQDYITEKFWSRLMSPSYFLPIAMGGISIADYTRVAPQDSFIHVYNFTSIEELGKYMAKLMEDDEAYNKYHKWRHLGVEPSNYPKFTCRLCEIANQKPLPIIDKLSDWWNDESKCMVYKEGV